LKAQIETLSDTAQLAEAAARHFARAAARALRNWGEFAVALSGGSTPRAAYEKLARLGPADGVDWKKVQLYWGDERCVPPEHPQSNFRLARESLLDRLKLPAANIHRMPGELEPHTAAQAYEADLRQSLSARVDQGIDLPRFDLILLGLGLDGHTASLLPGSPALTEYLRWVLPQETEVDPRWRITLTLPVINAAAEVIFLVSGREKAQILRRVLREKEDLRALPAQAVQPARGDVIWLADGPAASLL
jgi:6-phosphogluconolactonase